jgi:hypothetical protein
VKFSGHSIPQETPKNLIRTILRKFAVATLLLLAATSLASPVAQAQAQAELPSFDQRAITANSLTTAEGQRAALAHVRSLLPDAQVDFDELVGSPKWIRSPRGFLTGTNGAGGGISAGTLAKFGTNDPYRVTMAFLSEHSALFGHGPEVLANARVKREFTTPFSGLHTVVWEQQVDGIPIFGALLVSHVTRKGELVNVASHFLPGKATAGLQASPLVPASAAIVDAAQNLGETIAPGQVKTLGEAQGSDQHQTFLAPPFKGAMDARLVWLPMDRQTLRLCWDIILTSRSRNEMFRLLVDARNGETLVRQSLTERISNASYRVFGAESPTPMMPAYSSPNSNQPVQVARILVVTNAVDTLASPNGWINDGNNSTKGNNVDAYLDPDGDDKADTPEPTGSPYRVFDFPLDLSQDPVSYSNACVVNLFYWNNWMHDKLYDLGFTEAAGNYQVNNFGRGGLGGDPVNAEAQFGSGSGVYNASSFFVTPDGMAGYMQINIYNGPTPYRDGDFDTEVILHEYAHGLSDRRVGGGVGINPGYPQSQTLGLAEGWSDFYSIALLVQPGSDLNGCYPESPYAAYQLYGLTENYYFGFRRYPYSTDMTRSPETFKDIDPAQASTHPGVPLNPITSVVNAPIADPHNQGEIWCVTLWDARANLINKDGFSAGNQLILQLVTDGMNLSPANPTFVQARDAIIQADLVDTGGANYHELWQAFARRGMGYGATAPAYSTTSGVVESYAMPDDLLIMPAAAFTSSGTITGPFAPISQPYQLENTFTNTLGWTANVSAPWVSLSVTNGVLAGESSVTNVIVSLNNAANSLAIGAYTGAVVFSNLNSGVSQTENITLNVTEPLIYSFSLNSDPGWSRQGQWAFGQPQGLGGTSLSNPDPQSGATGTNVFGVNLAGDYSTAVGGPFYLTAGPFNFAGVRGVALQFERWLNTDSAPHAFATIDVSNDGTNWTSVFANGSRPIADSSWTQQQYDVSAVADNQARVYVRWGYQIVSGAFAYSGWNIDEIGFLGMSQLSVSVPPSATKGQGVLAGQGSVSIAKPLPANVTVSLTSSDPTEVTVPASVAILAGQTNVAFNLDILDNGLLTGPENVAITAMASGDLNGTNFITVFDNETAVLSVVIPGTAGGGDGQVAGTVNSSAAPARDISVSLASSHNNIFQTPLTVVIPAGQTSAVFEASIVNTNYLGDWPVTVSAHVTNWTDGQATITLQYGGNTNLTVTLPTQARENNGLLANAGLVQIAGILPTNLVVSLMSGNTNKVLVPGSVTIPAGQTSGPFNLTMAAGNPPFTPLAVSVNASATGFVDGSSSMNVIDNQTPPPPFNPSPANFSTANPVNGVVLSWSPGLAEGVEYVTNGGFESGDFTNWTSAAGTNAGWVIDNGGIYPPSGDSLTPPFAGNYSATADQPSPAVSVLYQDIALPTNAGTITLSWVDRIRNFGPDFDTNQQFSVEICDTNNVNLDTVFVTQPGATLLADWTQRSADISAFSGKTIRLTFLVNAGENYLDVHLDEVSVRCASLPTITYEIYLGTNSVPDETEYLGSTTNTGWAAPQLSPVTTYYWQIVAERMNQTPGPIWQFSTLSALYINDAAVAESASGTTNAVFTVNLVGVPSQPVSVNFATANGTAVAPNDYIATNGMLTFDPGQTNATIIVAVNLNTNSPPPRQFFVNLSNPANAALGAAQGIGSLLNSVTPPVLASISNRTVHAETVVSFYASASDSSNPNDVLAFSLDPGAPAGAAINSTNGLFTWAATGDNVGTNVITVRVTDSDAPGLSAAQAFSISVVPRPTVSPVHISGGTATISWSAIPGQAYQLQSTISLPGGWTNVDGYVMATNSMASKSDNSLAGSQRYYRVVVAP